MTDSSGAGITTAETIFLQIVWQPVVAGGLAALFVAVPWLNLPVVRQLLTLLTNTASDWLFKQMRLVIDVTVIELRNSAHQQAYQTESLNLKIAALDSGTESPQYAQALAHALLALSQFTQFGQ